MNAILPSGVEQYLKEAGFSATEMLLLRKLVEEDSLTIRELASKTGKSTGVLDQAMKKLMTKKIAQKNIINDQPRYSINSLDAVLRWVKQDMLERKSTLERRHENFESFIATLKVDKKRPDIEHFHGAEGMKQAYLKLLESGQELLTVTPILHLTEEDPFRLFRVEYFRRRQVRKIFQRILAPDSTLARRFQSRDPFEYRKTLLVSENELPVAFEKTIVGDTIACFNFDEESACFLKYPDLAKAERAAFETLWSRQLTESRSDAPTNVTTPAKIALKTRIYSSLREFVLSRRSMAMFGIFALVSGAMTFGLYQNNRELNLNRLQDKVLAIASTGVLQFQPSDIEAIRKPEDIKKPEYANLVATLNLIRRSNGGIQYAYVFRKTADPTKLEFVADADSLNPAEKKDLNHDGFIDEKDSLLTPGDPYDAFSSPSLLDGFKKPSTDIGHDQWGTFISGYAPIKNSKGEVIALLGVDVFISELDRISAESFTPVYFFCAFFILFLLIRFISLNRSLLGECAILLGKKKRIVFFWFLLFMILITCGLYAFDSHAHYRLTEENGERLMAIAATAASDFDPKDLNQLHFAQDMKTEAYQKVFRGLNEIRNKNPDVSYAYIMRLGTTEHLYEFVADADSNFNLPAYTKYSIFDTSALDAEDENIWPGFNYDDSNKKAYSRALNMPMHIEISDQWGRAVTGCAPIVRNSLILCIDKQIVTQDAYGMRWFTRRRLIKEKGDRLMTIATNAVGDFRPEDLRQLHFARDMKTDAYQKVFNQLNKIRNANPEISVAYIVRPTSDPVLFEFVANSDANYNLPFHSNSTIDDTDFGQDVDESPWPGYIYEDFFPVFRLATKRPAYGFAPVDKWGSTITGMAPIFENGVLIGILSLDVIIDNRDNLN